MHSITSRTFFFHNGPFLLLNMRMDFRNRARYNFMLVSINRVLARYKTDQYQPCVKYICLVFFQNFVGFFLTLCKTKH
jgi:hypothetical protein